MGALTPPYHCAPLLIYCHKHKRATAGIGCDPDHSLSVHFLSHKTPELRPSARGHFHKARPRKMQPFKAKVLLWFCQELVAPEALGIFSSRSGLSLKSIEMFSKQGTGGGPGSFRMGGQNMNSSDFVIFHCCFHTFITAENHFLSIPNSNRAKESAGTLGVGQTTLNHSGEQKFRTVLSHQP